MPSYTKTIIVGNVGRDPEMRFTPAGVAVTAFSVGINQKYSSDKGDAQWTDWYRVEAWNKLAELCNQYLKKGSAVLVEGVMKSDRETGGPRVWTDRDGKTRASFELTATTVRFLTKVEKQPEPDGDF